MSLKNILLIILARWKILVGVIVSIIALTLIISLVMPTKYTASSDVMIDIRTPDSLAGTVVPAGMLSPSYLATQLEVIQSERVAVRALESLNLHNSKEMQDQWREVTGGTGDFKSWLAQLLLENLNARPSRESNVIEVSYTAADPNFASAMANAFVRAYLGTSLDFRVDPARQYSAIFDEQVKQARTRLEHAQAALSSYQQDKGIIANDERLDIENARLNELSSQLVMLQSLSADSTSRSAQVASNSDKLQEVITNPVIGGLKAELARQDATLKQLSERYGDAHPSVMEARASANELRARIDNETRRVASSVNVSNSVNTSKEAKVRQALEQQRQKVLRMKQERDQSNVLFQDVDNAQRNYDALQTRLRQSTLESAANMTNLVVIKNANPPVKPSSPRTLLNLLIATFLSVLLGLAAAIGFELLDRRLRSHEDISDVLKVPLLAVIPKTDDSAKSESLISGRLLSNSSSSTPKLAAP